MTANRVWRKSSRSNDQSACVELSVTLADTYVQDSKNPSGGCLMFNDGSFGKFLAQVKAIRRPEL